MQHSARPLVNNLLPFLTTAAVASVLGGAIVVGGSLSAITVFGVCGAALLVVFSYLSLPALLVWAPASVLLYPFLRYPQSGSLITFDRVWIGALAVAVALTSSRQNARMVRRVAASLTLLVAVFGLRALTSGARPLSTGAVWVDAIVLPVALFFITRELSTSRQYVQQLVGSLSIAGAVLAVIGLAERVIGFELALLSGGSARFDAAIGSVRISGPYSAPEPYALALLICFAATLAWTQLHNDRWLVVAPVICLELAALYLTYFRAAWIGALVIAITSIGLRPGRVGRAIVVTTATAAVLFVAADQLQENRAFATRTADTTNIKGRLATYQEGVDIFREHPLFGVGVEQYAEAQRTVRRTVGGVDAVSHPHSTFIAVLAEQGIVGFLPLAGAGIAVGMLIRRYRQTASERVDVVFAASLLGAAAAYLLMSSTLTMITYGPSNALFAVALGIGAGRLSSTERER